jgi:hypothetical protein
MILGRFIETLDAHERLGVADVQAEDHLCPFISQIMEEGLMIV